MVRASYSWFSNLRRRPLRIFHAAAFVAFRLAATPICRRPGCASSQTAGPGPTRLTVPTGRRSSGRASSPRGRHSVRNRPASRSSFNKIRITLFVDGSLSHGVAPACAGGVDHASRVRLTSSRLYRRRPSIVGSSSLSSSMNPLPGAQCSRKFNGTPIGPS